MSSAGPAPVPPPLDQPPAMPGYGGRMRAFGIVVSVLALAGFIWWALRQPAPTLPSTGPQWLALAGAVAAYAVATMIRGERWLGMLNHGGARAHRSDAWALTAVAYMGNGVLPARAGDAMRVVLLSPRCSSSMREITGTLIAERLLDVALLMALLVPVSLAVTGWGDELPLSSMGLIAAALALALAAGFGAVLLTRRTGRGRAVVAWLTPLGGATRGLKGRHLALMAVLTVLVWVAEAATFGLAARSVGLTLNPIEALYMLTLTAVFVMIPAGPGHLGTMEAAFAIGARSVGASGGVAVAYALMLRFVLIVPIAIVGLALLWLRYGGLGAALRSRRRGREPALERGP